MRFVIPFLLVPSVVTAEPHWMSVFYEQSKCTEIIATIDAPTPDSLSLEARMVILARMGMAFGYLLGFDEAAGPLNGERETVLQNFREYCAKDPDKTGLETLRAMAPD